MTDLATNLNRQDYWLATGLTVLVLFLYAFTRGAAARDNAKKEDRAMLEACLVGPPPLGGREDHVDFGAGAPRSLAAAASSSPSSSSSAAAAAAADAAAAKVTDIIVYPIKSCRGISVRRAAIGRCGFVNDRRFMVVNTANGKNLFCSQRTMPKLALVSVFLDPLSRASDAEVKTAALTMGSDDEEKRAITDGEEDGDSCGADYDASTSSVSFQASEKEKRS